MIDFHSHILPNIDDGSQSVEESICMLQLLARQGIKTVIATPHFYANHEKSADAFTEKRRHALMQLQPSVDDELPQIQCGAEVYYYKGISQMVGLEKLCIEGSSLLLLEMPISTWTMSMVKELVDIMNTSKITLVLAHVERYIKFQKKGIFHRLLENGVLMQANANFFTDLRTRRKAFSMLLNGQVHFIGSDCHNVSKRPPNIGAVYKLINKKVGEEFEKQIHEYGYAMLNK